jgi:hypothetical protein
MATKNKTVLFNPEPTPVVYDEEGRTLGSIERVTLDELNPVARSAVEAGLLVEEKPAEPKGKAANTTSARSADRAADKTDSGSGVSTQEKPD